MTHREFRAWCAYLSKEPLGAERADWQAALIAHSMGLYHWSKAGAKGQAPQLKDYVIDWWQEVERSKHDPEAVKDSIRIRIAQIQAAYKRSELAQQEREKRKAQKKLEVKEQRRKRRDNGKRS